MTVFFWAGTAARAQGASRDWSSRQNGSPSMEPSGELSGEPSGEPSGAGDNATVERADFAAQMACAQMACARMACAQMECG